MYDSADAVCPYYRNHTRIRVECEGRGNGVSCDELEKVNRYIKKVCGNHAEWKKCPIARKLNKKYNVEY